MYLFKNVVQGMVKDRKTVQNCGPRREGGNSPVIPLKSAIFIY